MQRFRIFTNLIRRETYLWKIERKINFKAENVINVNYYRCCMPFNLARFIFTLTSSFMLFKSLTDSSYFKRRNNLINTHKSQNTEFDSAPHRGREKENNFHNVPQRERERESHTLFFKNAKSNFFFSPSSF